METVTFTVVGEWTPEPWIETFVWVAFDERIVAIGERMGPDNHAGVFRADELDGAPVVRVLRERGWEWMLPYFRRLAAGDDVRAELLAEAKIDDPDSRYWDLDTARFRE